MNVQTKNLIKEITEAAKVSVMGSGSGKRYTVDFKQKVASALANGHITSAMAIKASGASVYSIRQWVATYHNKPTKTIAVSRKSKEKPLSIRAGNVSIKSLEKRRQKAVEQFVQAKQDIEKIDKALAILDALDLSAL